jgi:hypothetical protein
VHEVYASETGADDEDIGLKIVGILVLIVTDARSFQADICAKRHLEGDCEWFNGME